MWHSALQTGLQSALHLGGMTLIVGAAVIAALHALTGPWGTETAASVNAAVRRAVGLGLALSLATGVLLVLPRFPAVVGHPFFRLKIAFLASAITWHVTIGRTESRRSGLGPLSSGAALVSLGLWFGVAAYGAAFILFE